MRVLDQRYMILDVVLKKIQIFNFFEKAQKRSKLSENDIYIYLRLFPKYGAKHKKESFWNLVLFPRK